MFPFFEFYHLTIASWKFLKRGSDSTWEFWGSKFFWGLRTCMIIGAFDLNFPREYQTNLTVNNYFRADNRLFPWGANSCRMSQNERLKLHKLHVRKKILKKTRNILGENILEDRKPSVTYLKHLAGWNPLAQSSQRNLNPTESIRIISSHAPDFKDPHQFLRNFSSPFAV